MGEKIGNGRQYLLISTKSPIPQIKMYNPRIPEACIFIVRELGIPYPEAKKMIVTLNVIIFHHLKGGLDLQMTAKF